MQQSGRGQGTGCTHGGDVAGRSVREDGCRHSVMGWVVGGQGMRPIDFEGEKVEKRDEKREKEQRNEKRRKE